MTPSLNPAFCAACQSAFGALAETQIFGDLEVDTGGVGVFGRRDRLGARCLL
ncbi:hypothetical protein ACFSUD_00470 [Sulfitobacter aestuarii]|uniref:Uncharacterized protein n=1 Tax=Sulfitobacter aestuarii TaxID=2161676 RepID=A0ABW5TX09_9RHOB